MPTNVAKIPDAIRQMLCRTVSRPFRPCVDRPCSPEVQRPAGTSAVAWRELAAARSCMDRGRTSPPRVFCADKNWQLRLGHWSSESGRGCRGSYLKKQAHGLRCETDVASDRRRQGATDHRRAREGEARAREVSGWTAMDTHPCREIAVLSAARRWLDARPESFMAFQ